MTIALSPMGSEQFLRDATRHLVHYQGPLDVVVDIGAHIGSLSLMAAQRGAKRVVAVEPMSANYENLLVNIATNGFAKTIEAVNAMIVADTGKERQLLCPAGLTGCCSMIVNGVGTIEVPRLIAFKDFLTEFEQIDYLKIDIEGGEFEIFDQSLELNNLLRRVRFLDLEIHKLQGFFPNYETITRYSHSNKSSDEIISYLRDIGFHEDVHPQVLREHGPYAFGSRNFNFMGGYEDVT